MALSSALRTLTLHHNFEFGVKSNNLSPLRWVTQLQQLHTFCTCFVRGNSLKIARVCYLRLVTLYIEIYSHFIDKYYEHFYRAHFGKCPQELYNFANYFRFCEQLISLRKTYHIESKVTATDGIQTQNNLAELQLCPFLFTQKQDKGKHFENKFIIEFDVLA